MRGRISVYFNRDVMLASLGIACIWAWRHVLYLGVDVFPWLSQDALPLPVLILSLAFLVICGIVIARGDALASSEHLPRLVRIVTFVGTAGGILAVFACKMLASQTYLSQVLAIMGLVLAGLSLLALFVAWSVAVTDMEIHTLSFTFSMATLVNNVLFLVIPLLFARDVYPFVMPFLILCSGLLLRPYSSGLGSSLHAGTSQLPQLFRANGSFRRGLYVLLAFLAALLVYEMLKGAATTSLDAAGFEPLNLGSSLAGIIVAVFTAILILVLDRRVTYNMMLRTIVSVAVVSLLVSILIDDEATRSFIVGFGHVTIWMMFWIALVDIARRFDVARIPFYTLAVGCICLEELAGKAIMAIMGSVAPVSNMNSFQIICSVVIIVLLVVVLGDNFVGALWPASNAAPQAAGSDEEVPLDFGPIVDEMAQRYGLTPKEKAVFELLARGRSLPAIEERLHISKGTAQAHATHVYRKLGIHSRQELIDLVENTVQEHA